MKRIEIIFLLGFCALTSRCQQQSTAIDKQKSALKISENVLYRNMGEPTGDQIKNYSFYMAFYHLTAFENLELFSIVQAEDTVRFNRKTTDAFNIRFLSNDAKADSAISFITFFEARPDYTITEIRQLITKYSLDSLHQTNNSTETILDGDRLNLIIYDEGKLITIDRKGLLKDFESNYFSFFQEIKSKYFKHTR